MGLLRASDWQASWIGYDAERVVEYSEADFGGGSWICHPEDTAGEVPAGHRLYVARFNLPEDVTVDEAEVLAIADDKLWMAVLPPIPKVITGCSRIVVRIRGIWR